MTSKTEKEQAIKYQNIIIKFSDYSFEDFIETLVKMAVHKDDKPLSETGIERATQNILDASKNTKENIFENFKNLLKQEKVNDFLRYQKFFKIQDEEIKEMLSKEIKKTFISLTQKEDLIHAFDIKHLISEQDFNDIINKDLKETIQKKIEQYIQTGEINFFDKMINVFNLKESNYINEQNKKLAFKGIGCCLENKNLEKLKQIKEKFKIQNTEIIENIELQEKIINLLKGYLNEGGFNEFKKTCDNLGLKKEDIVNNSRLKKAALQGIEKALKTSYNTSQAVLIKEFFNFSINTLNDNLDTYIQDPEKEVEKN